MEKIRNELEEKIKNDILELKVVNLKKLRSLGKDHLSLPYTIRVLLENLIRDPLKVSKEEQILELIDWDKNTGKEIPFSPYRVLLQDYTGVPLIVDLAAMRDALKENKLDPKIVDTRVPVHLVIDHSVQVDSWAVPQALLLNLQMDYKRNSERYSLLKWAQSSFTNLKVFPPGKGICHQVNLEYISKVVVADKESGYAYPDTLIGTDSHTPMVNGLGVLGWGVGGIEAEAVILGEPYYMSIPKVVGVELYGSLKEGTTTTDLVLKVTETLRKENVVDCFVEYFGEGYTALSVPDRATISNMSPEYGATTGFFPVDDSTLNYLSLTGRSDEHVKLVEDYCKKTGLFYDQQQLPKYSKIVKIDLGDVEPSVSGPRNPEERVPLSSLPAYFSSIVSNKKIAYIQNFSEGTYNLQDGKIQDGAIVIAAITSCTNTSNPDLMIGASLIAKRAFEYGIKPKPWVKTSFAPGSQVVIDYLEKNNLMGYLRKLGFELVGYGCTTCIGNSGPLSNWVEEAITKNDLYSVAVLSGNRNFDGRIHPLVKGSFLMSPMLVVIFSLVGQIDFDFSKPIGFSKEGSGIFLKDLWPPNTEIRKYVETIEPEMYKRRYSNIFVGDEKWESLILYRDEVFHWEENSTYIRRPPWFESSFNVNTKEDIINARVLLFLGDKITTDHISPAGLIPYDSPAGIYLREMGVKVTEFSTFGSRRGNHEVMIRGGFGNTRLKNILASGKEGWFTTHLPSGRLMSIYDASVLYAKQRIPLIVIAGKQYGTGSSRDWAAKVTRLLGIRAVIAESFERIHKSNLVSMGVLPLEFVDGENAKSLGLTGLETYNIIGIKEMSSPRERLKVIAELNESRKEFEVLSRIDNEAELKYYISGGILRYVFRKFLHQEQNNFL